MDADVVVCVSAAETVVNGGPGVLLSCGGPDALLHAEARSLLEPSGSPGWRAALAVEEALARRVALLGVSLALDQPRIADTAFGYPYDARAGERIAASRVAQLFRLLPGFVRLRIIRSLPVAITAAGAFAGPPSVAHAEALLRSIDLRAIELDAPLDAICLGIPRTTPYLPRERPNPLLAAYLGLGLALRLWRESPPVVEGGTAILLHRFHRRFSHPTQQPYRAFFHATRGGLDPSVVDEAERTAAADPHALDRYRGGRACHPLLAVRRLGGRAAADGAARDGDRRRLPRRGGGAALRLRTARNAAALCLASARPRARHPIGFLLAPPTRPFASPREPLDSERQARVPCQDQVHEYVPISTAPRGNSRMSLRCSEGSDPMGFGRVRTGRWRLRRCRGTPS